MLVCAKNKEEESYVNGIWNIHVLENKLGVKQVLYLKKQSLL